MIAADTIWRDLVEPLKLAAGRFAATGLLCTLDEGQATLLDQGAHFVAVTLNPAHARLIVQEPNGSRAVVHADDVPDDLGAASAAFVEECLHQLPEPVRAKVMALVGVDAAAFGVVVSREEDSACLVLDGVGPDPPVLLVTCEGSSDPVNVTAH